MNQTKNRENIIDELQQVPEDKIQELLDVIHFFRLGLQLSEGNKEKILSFAGCWSDMSSDLYKEFANDIHVRRAKSITRRKIDG